MQTVKKGSFVKVDYEGRLEDGTIFDSSHKHEGHVHLLEFEVGSGEVIPGFEKGIIGMQIGEEKEISISPEEAYGPRDERMIQKIPASALPKDQKPQKGMTLVIGTPDGHQFPASIVDVDSEMVTLDLNHPLAGKKLIFKVKVVEMN